MIRVYAMEDGKCLVTEALAGDMPINDGAVWIDLYNPSPEEERRIEDSHGFNVPTREELSEIETSSRLYRHNGVSFMTATVIVNTFSDYPVSTTVTFVLTSRVLVTVRYDDPLPFRAFSAQIQQSPGDHDGPELVFANLLDAIADRVADILEKVGSGLETLSHDIFMSGKKDKDFERKLNLLGRNGDVISKVSVSLVSMSRLSAFASQIPQIRNHESAKEMLSVISGDIGSLKDQITFLSSKTTFLLDATLGMINVEQNSIIKFFSVVAVVFLPPTLIASIYGMNFQNMPELSWTLGYPAALVVMLASMVAPYLFFKFKGWL